MRLRKLTRTLALGALVLAVLAFARGRFTPSPRVVLAQSEQAAPHCVLVGGTVMTDLAAIGEFTTLGTATGDLKGAVAATILSVSPGPEKTTLFSVQHHWVTEAGDIIKTDVAHLTAIAVAPGLFAVITYPVKIVPGGTGRFAGATGGFDAIGEVDVPKYPDLTGGRTVFRYSGQVCFAAPDNP